MKMAEQRLHPAPRWHVSCVGTTAFSLVPWYRARTCDSHGSTFFDALDSGAHLDDFTDSLKAGVQRWLRAGRVPAMTDTALSTHLQALNSRLTPGHAPPGSEVDVRSVNPGPKVAHQDLFWLQRCHSILHRNGLDGRRCPKVAAQRVGNEPPESSRKRRRHGEIGFQSDGDDSSPRNPEARCTLRVRHDRFSKHRCCIRQRVRSVPSPNLHVMAGWAL